MIKEQAREAHACSLPFCSFVVCGRGEINESAGLKVDSGVRLGSSPDKRANRTSAYRAETMRFLHTTRPTHMNALNQ